MAEDGADGGMNQRGVGPIAGFDIVRGAFVVAFFADHRAHKGELVHDLGNSLRDRDVSLKFRVVHEKKRREKQKKRTF